MLIKKSLKGLNVESNENSSIPVSIITNPSRIKTLDRSITIYNLKSNGYFLEV